jgi:hypothetical protein
MELRGGWVEAVRSFSAWHKRGNRLSRMSGRPKGVNREKAFSWKGLRRFLRGFCDRALQFRPLMQ